MARQPFNDFLNAAPGGGQPAPRGGYGGRGGDRGGRGGRGGGVGGGQGGVKSFKTDYSAVPFDYTAVNRQQYTKMDGFTVAPFGGNVATPGTPYTSGGRGRGRGGRGGGGASGGSNYTPRGRGRVGLGFSTPGHVHHVPSQNQQDSPGPSGYGTPVTGLGFHRGRGRGIPGSGVRTPMRTESTVGRGIGTGEVTWGGRGGAPIFVKAGELFKDGEVDIITLDKDKAIQVETMPLSDPSAPQMVNLRDEVEIDFVKPSPGEFDTPVPKRKSKAHKAQAAITAAQVVLHDVDAGTATSLDEVETLLGPPREGPKVVASKSSAASTPTGPEATTDNLPTPSLFVDTAPQQPVFQSAATLYTSHLFAPIGGASSNSKPAEPETSAAYESPIPGLFVDTAPQQPAFPSAATLYTSHLFAPVGSSSSGNKPASDDEEIVFRPRKYKKPQPMHVELPKAQQPAPVTMSNQQLPQTVTSVPPHAAKPHSALKQVTSRPVQPIQAFVDPRALKSVVPRKDKKAAKKEKKKKKNAKGADKKLAARREDMGVEDDIQWGSDGPSKGLLRIGGLDEEDMINMGSRKDLDMEILRDYLEGTLLGAKNDDDTESDADGDDAMAGINVQGKAKGKGKAKAPEIPATLSKAKESAEEKLEKGKAREKKKQARDWEIPPAAFSSTTNADDENEGDWEDEDGDAGQDGHIVDVESASDDELSDESSVIGDLQAIMDAFSSEDSEDEEKMMNGINAWTSEDEGEWFIRNMEEALGGSSSTMTFGLGGRGAGKGKGKAALFKSIEDGDFEMDLPTEPVKKGKKKAQGIPEPLQSLWESDRQKKAAKKQQRELDRLIAEIDVVKTSKKKPKSSTKAQQAALAHLIPASASQVADMFDIDSDDESARQIRGVGKMRKMMNLPDAPGQGGVGEIEDLVERVREFVRDPGQTTMQLHPMEKEGRQRMHFLAECFGMTSRSKGSGKSRFTVFIKTSRTGLHVNESQLEKLISASQYSGGHFYKALYSKYSTGSKGKSKGEKTKKGPGDRGTSGRAKEGDLVGEGADRIGVENMGHKLLSMMGWAEGGRIGRSDGGLANPIVAVVKNTKSGLGA